MSSGPSEGIGPEVQYAQLHETYRATRQLSYKVAWTFLVVNGALLGAAKWLVFESDCEDTWSWCCVCLIGALSCIITASQIVVQHGIIRHCREYIAKLEGVSLRDSTLGGEFVMPRRLASVLGLLFGLVGAAAWIVLAVLVANGIMSCSVANAAC